MANTAATNALAPHRSSHPPQHEEEPYRHGRVQQHIGEVVPPRCQTVDLAVEHVRDPRQRMPVAVVTATEDPGDSVPGESLTDVRVGIHVHVVINVDELVSERPAEDQSHRQHEKTADGLHEIGRALPSVRRAQQRLLWRRQSVLWSAAAAFLPRFATHARLLILGEATLVDWENVCPDDKRKSTVVPGWVTIP